MVTWSVLLQRASSVVRLLCVCGPLAVVNAAEVVDFRVAERRFDADLFRSPTAPRGTIVLSHGFLRDRQSLGALASELADRGALVLVPDLPFLADSVGNASALSAIVIDVRTNRRLAPRVGCSAGSGADRVPGILEVAVGCSIHQDVAAQARQEGAPAVRICPRVAGVRRRPQDDGGRADARRDMQAFAVAVDRIEADPARDSRRPCSRQQAREATRGIADQDGARRYRAEAPAADVDDDRR
jgi:hypothetical protein